MPVRKFEVSLRNFAARSFAMIFARVASAKISFVSTVQDFAAFLLRPSIIDPQELAPEKKAKAALALFVLSMILTAGFGVFALPFLLAMEASPGDQISRTLESSALSMMVSVILLGPFVEEIIFRGWLYGTWRSIVACGLSLGAVYGGSALLAQWFGEIGAIKSVIVLAVAVPFLWALAPLDSGPRFPGFEKIFPLVFWGQGIVFGALHFQNLVTASPVISIIATAPLIACGLIWGYARIKLGLMSAISLHAAYNVPTAFGAILLMQLSG